MSLGFRSVIINPLVYDLNGAPATSNAVVVRIRPSKEYDDGTGTGGVEKIWSPPIRIQGSPATKDFPVTPVDLSWALEVMIEVLNDGYGGRSKRTIFVAVPAGGPALELEALQRINPKTLQPVSSVVPAVEARIQDLEQWRLTFDPGSGGPLTSSDLDDATPLSIEFIGSSTQADARDVIDAAAVAHTHPLDDLETTGTPDSSKFLNGAGAWTVPPGSGGGVSWPVSGTPSSFTPSAHNHEISEINGLSAALTALSDAIALRALKNNPVFTGTTFTATAGTIPLAALDDLVGYLRDDWGFLPIIWINDVTDAWPSTRVVPAGYGSGPAYLDSTAVPNAATPTIGIASDRWRRKKPTV